MTQQYTISQKYFLYIFLLCTISIFSFTTACHPFDKEIKQDQHITTYRHQLGRVQDSIDNMASRITAYESIISYIHKDAALITLRKKNNLLIEGNDYLRNEYLMAKDYKKAIGFSNVILQLDSASAKGYYKRGCIYQAMGNDSLALLDYNKTIGLNPDYTDAYYNRGIIYENKEQYEQALKDYNRAIRMKPSYLGDVYNNRGNVYLAENEIGKALEDYGKAIGFDSTDVKAYCNRAWAYFLQEDYDKALSDCNKVLKLDSLNLNAYTKRASIYEKKKNYKEAIKDYKEILKLDPSDKFDTHEMSKQSIQRLKSLVSKGH